MHMAKFGKNEKNKIVIYAFELDGLKNSRCHDEKFNTTQTHKNAHIKRVNRVVYSEWQAVGIRQNDSDGMKQIGQKKKRKNKQKKM